MDKNALQFNAFVTHPLQSYEWGEFRKKLGTTVIREQLSRGESIETVSMTLHPIPRTSLTVGYVPKCTFLSEKMLTLLSDRAKKHKAIFIQFEPNLLVSQKNEFEKRYKKPHFSMVPSAHPLFTKYTFILDLKKTEEELLKNMHSKTRYNIRVAQKHGVVVKEDNTDAAFKKYLELTEETTKRQHFFAHTKTYHKTLWEVLSHTRNQKSVNALTSHLFTATYENKTLAAWIVFVFKDTLYYPYGASSSEERHVMASNLLMWEVIRFGRKLNLSFFDMWGALGPDASPKDSWFGFHKFKQGYNPTHTEFIGSYDLVLNQFLYKGYTYLDTIRWTILKTLKR